MEVYESVRPQNHPFEIQKHSSPCHFFPFEIEDLIEDSISVRFGKRRDMKLNIYYDQDAEDDDSFEEAFLTYKVDGIRYVENNSIQNAVRSIKKLLI